MQKVCGSFRRHALRFRGLGKKGSKMLPAILMLNYNNGESDIWKEIVTPFLLSADKFSTTGSIELLPWITALVFNI